MSTQLEARRVASTPPPFTKPIHQAITSPSQAHRKKPGLDPIQIVTGIVPGATVRELSASANRAFRLLEESGASSIVKIYATAARERRERHALEVLVGVPGVPEILERGAVGGTAWIRMSDGGSWNLATLPKNLDIVAHAGKVLRAVHDSEGAITNLGTGIDGMYVESHFRSTLDRLERYRRRLGMDQAILDLARQSHRTPQASTPVPAHTRPSPNSFLVADDGSVTLIAWEWATLAPPEWDLSFATWQLTRVLGRDAAEALWSGYGASFPQYRLKPWIAYHAATSMLEAAEQRDGRLDDLRYLVDDLAESLG